MQRFMQKCIRLLKNLGQDQEGSALVEVAIFATTMMVFIPVMSSYADRINTQQSLSIGVRSGLQYMMANQSVSNDTLTDIVKNSGAGTTNPINVSSSVGCECSNGLSATCGSTCADGRTAAKYLTVTASTNVSDYWGHSTRSITQQTSVRVQ